jgi:hypothetical protein
VVGGGVETVDGVGVGETVVASELGVGVSVGATQLVASPGVGKATVGKGGSSVSERDGDSATDVGSSLPPNGPNSTRLTRPQTTTSKTVGATSGLRLGPPYRPRGPLTRRPSPSTQNGQSSGADGHDSSGDQYFGGRHRTLGGSGQPGGVLKCLTQTSSPEVFNAPQPRASPRPTPYQPTEIAIPIADHVRRLGWVRSSSQAVLRTRGSQHARERWQATHQSTLCLAGETVAVAKSAWEWRGL